VTLIYLALGVEDADTGGVEDCPASLLVEGIISKSMGDKAFSFVSLVLNTVSHG
jgi:hypothetical protein